MCVPVLLGHEKNLPNMSGMVIDMVRDYAWTYVGAMEVCVEELAADSELESVRVRLDHRASAPQ